MESLIERLQNKEESLSVKSVKHVEEVVLENVCQEDGIVKKEAGTGQDNSPAEMKLEEKKEIDAEKTTEEVVVIKEETVLVGTVVKDPPVEGGCGRKPVW